MTLYCRRLSSVLDLNPNWAIPAITCISLTSFICIVGSEDDWRGEILVAVSSAAVTGAVSGEADTRVAAPATSADALPGSSC